MLEFGPAGVLRTDQYDKLLNPFEHDCVPSFVWAGRTGGQCHRDALCREIVSLMGNAIASGASANRGQIYLPFDLYTSENI